MAFSEYNSIEEFKETAGYDLDGVWYPRITKIVGIKAKPALYYYYASAPSYAVAKEQTEKSAEEGTRVHEAIEKILIGEEPDTDAQIAPSIEAFKQFYKENNIEVLPENIELRVLHPSERYAGTVDALCYLNGRLGILDVKTSNGIYRDYSLQTAAYMGAVKEIPDFKDIETRWILRVDQISDCMRCGAVKRVKGGREKIRRGTLRSCPQNDHDWSEVRGLTELKEFTNFQSDYEAFLGAKKLWEWENIEWLNQVGYSAD